jgi:hypothetical protein
VGAWRLEPDRTEQRDESGDEPSIARRHTAAAGRAHGSVSVRPAPARGT